MIDYIFNEPKYLDELKRYIDSTYDSHYGKDNKIQSTQVIIDRGRGIDFCLGNVDKYSNRYGFKGDRSDHRKDLMKLIHYALLALHAHDVQSNKDEKVVDVPVTGIDVKESSREWLIHNNYSLNEKWVYALFSPKELEEIRKSREFVKHRL